MMPGLARKTDGPSLRWVKARLLRLVVTVR
jgi:hypothetical protein